MSNIGDLFWWNFLDMPRMYKKLSWILLPLMKALWHLEIIFSIISASLSKRSFINSFATLWIRLIGMKSSIFSTPSFFGSKMILASFKMSKFWNLYTWRVCMTAIRSCLMMGVTPKITFWWFKKLFKRLKIKCLLIMNSFLYKVYFPKENK